MGLGSGIQDPGRKNPILDPGVKKDPDPQHCLLSLKSDVNVPSVRNKQKKPERKNKFYVNIMKVTEEKSRIWLHTVIKWNRSVDPDPY